MPRIRLRWRAMYDAAPATSAAPGADAELCARVNVQLAAAQVALLSEKRERCHGPLVWLNIYGRQMVARIEELARERDEARAGQRLLSACSSHETQRAEKAEADLARALEILAEVVRISDRKHDAWDAAHELLGDRK